MVPEAYNLDSLLGEKLVAFFIARTAVRQSVFTAIQFNSQLCERAVEIEEVRPTRVLAPEFEIIEATIAEQVPEASFGLGGFLPEAPGKGAGLCSAGAMFSESRTM